MRPHTVFLHDAQELDDDLGAGSDQNLALAGLLGVVDALESVIEDGCFDHVGGVWFVRFSSRVIRGLEVSVVKCVLVFRSLEQKECPTKGSSARVAKDERIQSHVPWKCYIPGERRIAHLRLAEEVRNVDIPLDL